MLTQELVKISRRFIGRVKITSQDLDHFSHTPPSGCTVSGAPTYAIIFVIKGVKIWWQGSKSSIFWTISIIQNVTLWLMEIVKNVK